MVAVGKAACAMAQGAQDALGGDIADALVITKRGYADSLPWPVLEAGHPLVDEASLEAGKRLFAFFHALDDAKIKRAVVQGVPERGIGFSVMNRLKKAASKRLTVS